MKKKLFFFKKIITKNPIFATSKKELLEISRSLRTFKSVSGKLTPIVRF